MKLDTSEAVWKEFDKYIIEEDGDYCTYDFSNAPEEIVQKVFNMMKDDDKISVIDSTNETHNVQKHHIDDMLEEAIEELDGE
jgi:hypothetical protein